jgi:hypothetical protein
MTVWMEPSAQGDRFVNDIQNRICFVIDQPDWAFGRSVGNLMRALGALQVRSTYCYQDSIPEVFDEEFVYACWWPDVEIIRKRLRPNQRLLCRIADMTTWSSYAPDDWQEKFRRAASMVYAFISASHEIDDSLRSIGMRNSFVVGDSVEVTEFSRKDYAANGRPLPVAGWCGNPMALSWLGFKDIKGVSVLSALRNRKDLKFVTATQLPPSDMPAWYRSIDVYVCASRLEGTPLPILEAMSAENVVISTCVGVLPEITSPGVFVFDGTVKGLQATVDDVLRRRAEWAELGRANRLHVLKYWTPTIAAERMRKVLCGAFPLIA